MAHRADGLNDIFEHDVTVRDRLITKEGTIATTPVNDSDIVNKEYVDTADALLVPYTGATGDVDIGFYQYLGSNIILSKTIGGYGIGVNEIKQISVTHTPNWLNGTFDTTGLYLNIRPTDSGSGNVRNVIGIDIEDVGFDASGTIRAIRTGAGLVEFGDDLDMTTNNLLNVGTANIITIDLGTNTIVDGAMTGNWDMNSGIMTEVNIDTGDIANAVTNTEWDLAYDHSIDNSQAHSDYLLNNADDTTTFKLTIGEVQVDKIHINDDNIYTPNAGENENGDDINIKTGTGGASNPGGTGYDGGDINITSGDGGTVGPGEAGDINLLTGTGDTNGDINIKTGSGGQADGNINIQAQNGTGFGEVHIKGTIVGGDAGVLYLQEDAGGTVVGDSGAHAGIKFYLQGDDGGVVASPTVCQFLAGTARENTDGNDSIFEATNAGTGNQNGGDILFNAGALSGTGSNGNLIWGLPNYKDINIGGYLLTRPASGAPDIVNFLDEAGADTAIPTYAFDVGEKVSGGFELQHDYEEGSDFVFHVHWEGIAAPSGTDNVQWRLTYILMRDGTTLNAAVTIDSPDTAFDTQYESVRTDFAAITGTTFKIGDQFMFTLERVTATGDAYAGDALIATAGIHYQVNTLGSRTIIVK